MLPMFPVEDEVQQIVKGGVVQNITKPTEASIQRVREEGAQRLRRALYTYSTSSAAPVPDTAEGVQERSEIFQDMIDCGNWAIGDMINRSHKLGVGRLESYRRAAAGMRKSQRWALELSKVAYAFPVEVRYCGIDWQLYRICARQTDPISWIQRAIEGGWTPKTLRQRLKATT